MLASAGFGHEVKVWVQQEGSGEWKEHGTVSPWGSGPSAAKVWAVALNSDEQFLACSSEAGKVAVWDIPAGRAVHLYETASEGQGSFGMSVDISPDGRLTASGHQNGTVYVFNNDSGRLVYSLTGRSSRRGSLTNWFATLQILTYLSHLGLSKPIRSVKFSPGGTRLATAGDAGIIAIYDTQNGEHVSNLSPSGPSGPWIMSLDWSHTGEYLLSGSFDGRVRVWSIEAATCVATHSESDETIWAVKWLPKPAGNPRAAESFCAAGARGSITFYREASGS